MAKIFISVLYTFFNVYVTFIFGPVFDLLDGLILTLNIDNLINNFLYVIDNYVVPFSVWFFEQIPPLTFEVIGLAVGFYIGFYSISFAINLILKALKLLKKFPMA